jgi:hypothetical protein
MQKLSERKFKELKKEEFSNKKRKKKLLRNDVVEPKKNYKHKYLERDFEDLDNDYDKENS